MKMKEKSNVDTGIVNIDMISFRLFVSALVLGAFMSGLLIGSFYY